MADIGDNSKLTEEQRQSLFLHHKRHYIDALAKKKEQDAAFKNTCKKAKAEGVDPAMIKFAIDLEGGDIAKIREEMAERDLIAHWMGVDLGGNGDLFDRRPAEEVSYDAGKRAGMSGDNAVPPDGFIPQKWMDGWHKGQEILMSTLSLTAEAKIVGHVDEDEEQGGLEEFV